MDTGFSQSAQSHCAQFPGSVLYQWKSEEMKTYWRKPGVKE